MKMGLLLIVVPFHTCKSKRFTKNQIKTKERLAGSQIASAPPMIGGKEFMLKTTEKKQLILNLSTMPSEQVVFLVTVCLDPAMILLYLKAE